MKKSLVTVCGFAALLLVIGGGCNNGSRQSESTDQPENTVTSNSAITEPTNALTLNTIASDASGMVRATWTVPANFDKTHSVRLLHSAKSTPEFPGAYWTQYTPGTMDATIYNVPAGQRYFRLCEFQSVGNSCVNYSNIMDIEVK